MIGRRLGVPVVSKPPEEAAAHFTWFARFVAFDVPSSSEHTQALLGWKPQQPGLIADIDHPAYFGGKSGFRLRKFVKCPDEWPGRSSAGEMHNIE